jgi:hypothetical protein
MLERKQDLVFPNVYEGFVQLQSPIINIPIVPPVGHPPNVLIERPLPIDANVRMVSNLRFTARLSYSADDKNLETRLVPRSSKRWKEGILFVDIIQRGVLGSPVSTSSSGPPSGTFWRFFALQVAIMLFGNSIMFVIVALCIAVYAEAVQARVWGAETITALCFAISFCFSTVCYLVSWYYVEPEMQAALHAEEPLVQSRVDDQVTISS